VGKCRVDVCMTPLLDTRVSHIKNNNPRDCRISCRDLSTAASLRLSDFSTRRGNQVTPSLAFGGCAIFFSMNHFDWEVGAFHL